MLSPALGLVLALVVSWTVARKTPFVVDSSFRLLQFVSASFYSLGDGGNDAQKTMGIIAVRLYSQGMMPGGFHVPYWVVLSCQIAMALGTLFGGWRIVHTMGSKTTRLTPVQGFCAETGGAMTLLLATWLGVPVSTTHTITGAIIGVGVGVGAARLRGALGRGRQHRRRLGDHPAGRRADRRLRLCHGRDLRLRAAAAGSAALLQRRKLPPQRAQLLEAAAHIAQHRDHALYPPVLAGNRHDGELQRDAAAILAQAGHGEQVPLALKIRDKSGGSAAGR
ncbi:inorganic phosphate transporter [Roseomonas sp. E05]|uniref:inorganic phosphate transporter n=1 Tax=Roseomonas sp. E05 TaxID=3046310 RepID=UPI0032D947AE